MRWVRVSELQVAVSSAGGTPAQAAGPSQASAGAVAWLLAAVPARRRGAATHHTACSVPQQQVTESSKQQH